MIAEFVKRAAEKCGFNREKYIENNLVDNFLAVPFFGDQKHEFILASFLLHRIKEETGKYIILCGWPNNSALFPYVDEYWSIKDVGAIKSMLPKADGFGNKDKKSDFFYQQLNRFFETLTPENLHTLYNNGFTTKFFERFKFLLYNLPSQIGLKKEIVGKKVFIQPTREVDSWRREKIKVSCRVEFWEQLIVKLSEAGYLPVVKQDASTYDLSSKYSGRAHFVGEMKILDQLALMRSCCVLDIFGGLSKLAFVARAPFVSMTERNLYIQGKDCELNDLCCSDLPHCYIFSFATMLEGKDYLNLVDLALAKINEFIPSVDPNKLPNTREISVVLPYLMVREQKAKRLGSKFFKIQKI